MRIFIEPNDVLMFRDGKPFAGGDDHFARGSFPPPPSTIYGALRAHILSQKSGKFNTFKENPSEISRDIINEIGTPNELGTLKITFFALAENHNAHIKQYFPIPTDMVREKGEDNNKFYILKPNIVINENVLSDLPLGLHHVWYNTDKALKAVSGFLREKQMRDYLMGEAPNGIVETKDLFVTEERTGIRKSRSLRSVETGGLYSVEYFRMQKGCGFILEVEGTKLIAESGILRLGGDHRSAYYFTCQWEDIDPRPIKDKIKRDKKFKTILLTPAIFKHGWLPEGINKNSLDGEINGIKVKMIGACIGKPIGIGGFDIVKGMPKDMKKAVPPGSVYYFELINDDVDKLFENLWLKTLSDERKQEGFGITLIGGI